MLYDVQLAEHTRIGSYEILGIAGRGAMGEVYEATDRSLGRKVALKVLSERHLKSEEFSARFAREGRALASLNHPNVLQVYDCGEVQGRPFLAMEFLHGDDVGALIKRVGPLRPEDAAEVVRQAAIGLSQTEEVGVVHRDVKPSNLVVTKKGRVIVTDFGLSKCANDTHAITKAGLFVGTPDYLAPEQALGHGVTVSADIYALGCTLFHMCVGHPPFRDAGTDDPYTLVVRRHLKAPRPKLSEEVPGVDDELSRLCRRMMSRRVEVRPSYEELVSRLDSIVKRCDGQCPPRVAEAHKLPRRAAGRDSAVWDASVSTSLSRKEDKSMLYLGVGIGAVLTALLVVMIKMLLG